MRTLLAIIIIIAGIVPGHASQDADLDRVIDGLDLFRPPKPSEIGPSAASDAALIREIQCANDKAKLEAKSSYWGGVREMFTSGPSFKPDPNFTLERFRERFTAAQKVLPESSWDSLVGTQSDAEFDYRMKQAEKRLPPKSCRE